MAPGGADTVCGTSATSHAARLEACSAEIESGAYSGRDLAVLYQNRGAYRIEVREYQQAIADFTAALAIEPDNSDALINRATAYKHLEKYDLALADLATAEKLVPNSAILFSNRAGIEAVQKNYPAAIQDYIKAQKYGPSPGFLIRLAYLYEKLGDHENAITNFTLAANSGWSSALAFRAYVYEETGRPDLARQDYLQVVNLTGDYAYTAALRCYARARMNVELDKALQDCDRAVAVSPTESVMHDARGFLFLRMKQYADAEAEFASSHSLEPEWAGSLYGRGVAKRAAGDPKGADADIRAALAEDSDAANEFAMLLYAGMVNPSLPGYATRIEY
jgi:tetratricopeptide (TPR) repeat protein